jgi:hypothetical protein
MTCVFLAMAASAGRGEEPLPDHELSRIPVRDRPRPDFEPIGYRLGPIFFYPKLMAGLRYDSNVFATSTDPRADFALVTSPRLTVRTASPSFSHELDLGADVYRFRELSSEDRIDAYARYRGRVEFGRDLELETKLEAARKHDERGEATTPNNAASPVPYNDLRGDVTLTKRVERSGVSLNAAARNLSYEDVESLDGTTLDQSWRSGSIFSAYLKPYYEFSPGYRAFVRLRGNTRNYEGTGDLNRDSRGYDLHGGVDFVATPLITGSVEAGYLSQTYDNSLIPAMDGLSFAGRLQWLFTPLMTVTFSAERKVAETTTPGFGGRLDTLLGVQLDYELLRNIIVSAHGKFVRQDFNDPERRDDLVKVGAGIEYLMNRHFRLGARYEFTDRNSSLPEFSFDRHTVMFNATAQH